MFTHLMSCSHHCLYSSSSINCVDFFACQRQSSEFDVWWHCSSPPAQCVLCFCGGTWNLPSHSMMACSYQPVLLTIEFIRMVGGGSTKERRWEEREREDPKNRTSTKRGKHVGHCRLWIWLELFNTGCWCLFVLILCCKSTCKWKCTQSFFSWIYMNSHSFNNLMSCSHHCLYSWSSMAGNCLETFDMNVNNSLQSLMFWATVLPLALGIFLVSQWWRVRLSQSC